jgi:hypothetical protein
MSKVIDESTHTFSGPALLMSLELIDYNLLVVIAIQLLNGIESLLQLLQYETLLRREQSPQLFR